MKNIRLPFEDFDFEDTHGEGESALPEFEVVVTGTYRKTVSARNSEEAEDIVLRDHFDPAYLKEKITTEVKEL